jgi:aminopeptidase N
MDFTQFFDQWYFGEGYPIYSITWEQNDNMLSINSIQATSMPSVTPFFKMHMPYKLFFADGTDTTLHLLQDSPEIEYNLTLAKSIDSIQLDPEKWVLKKVEFMSSIQESIKNHDFKISPNPANDKIFINFSNNDETEYSLSIFKISGELISKHEINESKNQIDLNAIPAGLYLIRISGKETYYLSKLIISR